MSKTSGWMDTLLRKISLTVLILPPFRSKFFPSRVDLWSEGLCPSREADRKSQKLFPFFKNGGKTWKYTHSPYIQSTLFISKSKGPSETLRDIPTSTYQMCRIEENTNRTTKFHTWTCKLTPIVSNIYWKYCGTRREIAPEEQFLLLSAIFCYLMLDFYVKAGIRISLRDKRLLEITDVEITRVDCTIFVIRIWAPQRLSQWQEELLYNSQRKHWRQRL